MAFVPARRPWVGDECRFSIAGCDRTPRPSGLCPYHERWMGLLGMTVRPGTHIRSLRMPPELARATSEAARRLGIPENRFICQAVRFVCREAGVSVEPEPDPVPLDDAAQAAAELDELSSMSDAELAALSNDPFA